MTLHSIEDVLDDYRQGRMVILTDDEDRENEGDLLIAAEKVTPEAINFMARHGRGLICLTLTEEHCRQLGLSLMVGNNNSRFSTAFTASIEAAQGVSTGISAADRATTVLAASRADARPTDIVTPGHIFPLMAQPGGVLTRAGHTETGCDLARLAGLQPASVICEILKEDGSMARMPDLLRFSQEHGIKVSTIADLIRYRREREPTVTRAAESRVQTADGDFRVVAYRDHVENAVHMAFVKGDIRRDVPVLVRVHVEWGLYDVFRELMQSGRIGLVSALRRIEAEGAGVLVVVRQHETDDGVVRRMQLAAIEGRDLQFPWKENGADLRMLGVGSQILADLGVGKMRVLGSPKRVHGLSGFDLEIVDYVQT
jgi:3,4-dihydroxy 2-butanone 4-phosphate synthase/GTP cyclohydrolase II